MVRTHLVAALLATLPLSACDVGEGDSKLTGTAKLDELAGVRSALAAMPGARVVGQHGDGIPHTLEGRLGTAAFSLTGSATADAHRAIAHALPDIAATFRLSASDLVVRRVSVDEQGVTHLRYGQTLNGLPVVGEELVVHVDAQGHIFAANGTARGGGGQLSAKPTLSALAASTAALRATRGTGLVVDGSPRLVYLRSQDDQQLELAYEVRVSGEGPDMPLRDRVYVSATDGSIVLVAPEIHSALNRRVYSANNGTTLPGTLKRSEGQAATGDTHVDKNYDQLGLAYQCYLAVAGRDLGNTLGGPLISTVHFDRNYVNAYWNGTQLVYGDGDNQNSIELGRDADLTVHELTHAVTERESNLTYAGQSGGLNEALSDTFAAACESWASGAWSTAADIWKIGEDVWTPATAGDAIRYMDDPVRDALSFDWAPNVTSTTDVHYSSGVPNLAFALLAKGGTHPRGRSAVVVPAIGVEKAIRIWNKASTDFYVPSTNFEQAKALTVQAAAVLGYDTATQDAVKLAWESVGVGVPPPPCTLLTNGVPVTGISGATGSSKYYCIDVPASRASSYVMSGGTGDVDLYVRIGTAPTRTAYDCRPYLTGNSETCNSAPQTSNQRIYVMLYGYATYSGTSLKATY
ncbi:M4 family metallopeptidase [Pyxidicoccus sp. MSG2]|uniref:M4 family metallopeptidase n=1 Tax=Pyxidicoccus sp. MSG2 TaxID=2996790 RepID=UPI00226FF73C|nr:M4 family metallopeptidase [Pyxidicoccus sp. MSG2]MCY1021720.1 M4 family metallopeptidase [Pyxidicoccus sp. MSG2]